MATPEQEELNAKTYMALGRYVVAFSGLLHALESSTVHLIVPEPDGRKMMLLGAALSERTASPVVAAFFSVFYKHWEGQMSDDDTAVMKCLRRELEDVVKERNRLMHDAWMGRTVGGDPGPHALARHRVRAHGTGVEFESEIYPPERLAELAEDVTRLSSVVNGSVWYHRPGQRGPELAERIRVVDKRVERVD
jgi:hypothetical protein